MNRNIVIIVLVILTLLGGGWYYKTRYSSPGAGYGMMKNNDSDDTGGGMGMMKGTLADLFAKNVPMTCTFNYGGDAQTSGTVYISGKKMRGEFTSKAAKGADVQTYMIRDDVYMYTWTSLQKQGMKMKIEEVEKEGITPPAGQTGSQPYDLDKADVDYNCKAWNVDGSIFTPPADVKFMDFSSQMKQIQKSVGGMKAAQCASCEQLPAGDSKTQCLKALGC